MLFAIARECWGCSVVFLRACPVRPTNAQLGTNLDCTVASRVVQCSCLPESLGKLWLHEDRHYHAGKSFDAVALTEQRQDEGSHLCILPLLQYSHREIPIGPARLGDTFCCLGDFLSFHRDNRYSQRDIQVTQRDVVTVHRA